MNEKLHLAPIALFVYKRPKHTKATLTALAKNDLAKQSDLFIFSDGARGDQDENAVSETRRIARNIKGFKSITVIERPKNEGLANSVIKGVTEILTRFESVIVLEDDLLTSKKFLTFMNNVLKHYSADRKVLSVTGHSFSDSIFQIPDGYQFDTYAGYRCSSWSWGIWRDRWEKIDWSMDYYPGFISDVNQQKAFNQGGDDLSSMLAMQYAKKIDSWAIRFSFAHFINDSRCIYPTKTLVRNIGLDNSGTHTRFDRRFLHTSLEDDWLPTYYCNTDTVDVEITKNFKKIFSCKKLPLHKRIYMKVIRALTLAHLGTKNLLDHLLKPSNLINTKRDILMVNTLQLSGGAARAAFRCFEGMSNVYPKMGYLSLFGEHVKDRMYYLSKSSLVGLLADRMAILDRLQLLWYPNRKPILFSPGFWANPRRIRIHSFLPKLVHLHWVSFGILNIEELSELNVPVVWTLHDEWAFTGGCHYAESCRRFEDQCGRCPVLGSNDPYDISNQLWLKKMSAYNKSDIAVVTPSRWMASEAKKSSLFSNKRIEVIPNGLNTDIFRPIKKSIAQNTFEIKPSGPVMLFGANLLSDDRKGGDLLLKAIAMIDFPCTLLVFGEGDIGTIANPFIEVYRLGNIDDDNRLAMMYSLADVFVCPSRIDNLPNTVAEAMACGVPCVAFDIGGLPDMIDHRINGWLATPFDPVDLLKGIKWVLQPENSDVLKQSTRKKALAEFSLSVMSERYQSLYEELLSQERLSDVR